MREEKIQLAKGRTASSIEEACLRAGLSISMKGSLKQLPVNTHWHFKLGKDRGVLELTFLPDSDELIFSVHDNRKGEWQDDMITRLREVLG